MNVGTKSFKPFTVQNFMNFDSYANINMNYDKKAIVFHLYMLVVGSSSWFNFACVGIDKNYYIVNDVDATKSSS